MASHLIRRRFPRWKLRSTSFCCLQIHRLRRGRQNHSTIQVAKTIHQLLCHASTSGLTWATQVIAQSQAARMRLWIMRTQGLCQRAHTIHSISVAGYNVGLHSGGTKVTRLWKRRSQFQGRMRPGLPPRFLITLKSTVSRMRNPMRWQRSIALLQVRRLPGPL